MHHHLDLFFFQEQFMDAWFSAVELLLLEVNQFSALEFCL
jgi:hypothetical protein